MAILANNVIVIYSICLTVLFKVVEMPGITVTPSSLITRIKLFELRNMALNASLKLLPPEAKCYVNLTSGCRLA